MFNNLFLGLSSISYIALVAVNLYKPKGTGDQLVGWGFFLFGIMAAYAICSLMLTINIAYKGKFDWISESNVIRNSIIGIGWLCLTAGVFYITIINADWKASGSANWLGLIMVHYGAIWIPLLMLVPYAILINPEWSNSVSPNMYKIPLLMGCLIGLSFKFLSYSQLGNLLTDKKALSNMKYEEEMKHIDFVDEVEGLLYYMYKDTDPRLTEAALNKLQKNKNLEQELVNILTDDQKDYRRVIAYLEQNKVENPEMFVVPLNNSIFKISEELKYKLQSFGSENGFLALLNVDGLCGVLDGQFKPFKEDFRPNMLKIQAELEKEPKPDFLPIRNKYRTAVQNWLDTN